MAEVEHVWAAQNELGEGPIWRRREQALYWVDIEDTAYFRYDPASGGGAPERIDVGVHIGALGARAAGGLVLACSQGFAIWDTGSRLRLLGNPEAAKVGCRFNDGAVDRRGRFWAGTLGDPFNNALYRLDPDGTIQQLATGFDICNGIGWSPDNRTMYFTDSTPAVIYAFDFDLESGAIANRRVFADSSDHPGLPDGLTVDSEGGIWSARWGAGCVERYDPAGKLERTLPVPATFPTSIAFGGAQLDTLYITSANTEIPRDRRGQHPLDGDLFHVHLDVRGLPEPEFAG